ASHALLRSLPDPERAGRAAAKPPATLPPRRRDAAYGPGLARYRDGRAHVKRDGSRTKRLPARIESRVALLLVRILVDRLGLVIRLAVVVRLAVGVHLARRFTARRELGELALQRRFVRVLHVAGQHLLGLDVLPVVLAGFLFVPGDPAHADGC